MGKRIVTEADVHKAVDNGTKTLRLNICECIITPQAQDQAELLGVTFIDSSLEEAAPAQACSAPASEACVAPAPAPAPVEVPAPVAAPAAPVAPAAPAAPAPETECSEADIVVLQVCALLQDKLPAGTSLDVLEAIVRRVVTAKLGDAACATTAPAAAPVAEQATGGNGICFIDGQRLQKQGSSPVAVDEQVFIADAIGACDNAKLAGGYMEWERASFTRTVESPEIGIVLEGELHLTIGGETKIGKAGDMMYFPEGVDVTYSTPTSVRIACVNNIQ
ncbi:cupin domain-containing protein [Halodesulfovibrio marinisediminis]|uniref:Ethanolamine utilization protein EutQ n=1 Tax=Halodesulfovibrio marinisediminis DSM 17456 TaxID=1121457 RepID=A0A1N6H4M5_9BACT|nr:cupin domain-containing protein [Halodesulfovibrio marinisediminis]SIO14617.1 ethanolamine utilization protein EutQ [Halodesulfovibrio marinisediminis DSM 17456]